MYYTYTDKTILCDGLNCDLYGKQLNDAQFFVHQFFIDLCKSVV